MVNTASAYDFAAVIDGFIAQKNFKGRHNNFIISLLRERALKLLAHPDVRYMPAFKILDMLAAIVNIGHAIDEDAHLRTPEINALLREGLSDATPLVRQFMLEAALERARYAPLMLHPTQHALTEERETILQLRWAAMRAAHQEQAALPDAWIDVIDNAVEHALMAEEFRQFRRGPLLQLFAEMLATARKLHREGAPLATLENALSEHGPLWRRYALKSARFVEKAPIPHDLKRHTGPHTIH